MYIGNCLMNVFYTTEKTLCELIAPTEERIKGVLDFLEDIKPSIEHRVVPINDIYGPTITDPEIQFIVLSEETKKGGGLINEERTKKVKVQVKL